MEKLHVLVVPSWYPNGVDKLMGQYHIDFCEALSSLDNVKVNMLYVYRHGLSMAKDYFFGKKEFEDKFDKFSCFGRKMLDVSKFSFDMQMKSYAKLLYKAYKKYEKIHGKPDVLHAQVALPSGYACVMLSKKINVPVIMTEHFSGYLRFFDCQNKKYNDIVMKEAKITCVSSFMVEEYKEKGVNADVLPNVVECKTFDKTREKRPEGRYNLVSLCAMRPGKRLENIIEAIKTLKEEIPAIHYTAIGDGELLEYYKKYANDSGLSEYVSFVGRKNHDEIAEIFTKMDCMLIPSDVETFAIPAVEAMAAGIPVVATKTQGPKMFLDDTCSIMCEIDDVKDLTRAIGEMYENLDNFDSEKLKATAKKFDSTEVARLSYKYYMEII